MGASANAMSKGNKRYTDRLGRKKENFLFIDNMINYAAIRKNEQKNSCNQYVIIARWPGYARLTYKTHSHPGTVAYASKPQHFGM